MLRLTPFGLLLSIVVISLPACETAPKTNTKTNTATTAKSSTVVAKHVPHTNDLRKVLREQPTMKEFSAYRDQWRDWPKDTGEFKTTTKYRLPGGEFLIWWKPDKYTPEATMNGYRLQRYRD